MTAKNHKCIKCNESKPEGEFTKNKAMKSGWLNCCKPCHRDAMRKYRSSDAGKEATVLSRAKAGKKYKAANRDKSNAHNAVSKAVRGGRLVRQPCEKCGSTEKIEGHHDSYLPKDRLNVRWLCKKHHVEWHRNNTPISGEGITAVPMEKLNTEAVKVIKYALKYLGFTQTRLAELHNVSVDLISKINTGKRWKEVIID